MIGYALKLNDGFVFSGRKITTIEIQKKAFQNERLKVWWLLYKFRTVFHLICIHGRFHIQINNEISLII